MKTKTATRTRTKTARRSISPTGSAPLSGGQRRLLAVLGLPAFGIALAYTTVTTYAPVLLSRTSGPAVTGLLIAMEGVFALVVPVLAGALSDRVRSPIGGRLPLIAAGAALAVVGLVMLPLLAGSRAGVGIGLAVFFVAYFVYYTPYYALYPDLVPAEERGRSQGFQGALRSIGLLLGIVGGGVLPRADTRLVGDLRGRRSAARGQRSGPPRHPTARLTHHDRTASAPHRRYGHPCLRLSFGGAVRGSWQAWRRGQRTGLGSTTGRSWP